MAFTCWMTNSRGFSHLFAVARRKGILEQWNFFVSFDSTREISIFRLNSKRKMDLLELEAMGIDCFAIHTVFTQIELFLFVLRFCTPLCIQFRFNFINSISWQHKRNMCAHFLRLVYSLSHFISFRRIIISWLIVYNWCTKHRKTMLLFYIFVPSTLYELFVMLEKDARLHDLFQA